MTILKKLMATAAASTVALSLGMAANAAIVLDTRGDQNGDNVLDGTDAFEFNNFDVADNGDLVADSNTGQITVGDDVGTIFLDFDTDQSTPSGRNARGIQNFSVMVEGNMGTQFMVTGITDADGNLVLGGDVTSFDVMGGETLTFVFDGTAFQQGPLDPGYSVGVFGDEVFDAIPLPGAAVFFLTAAGAGALRLRKKAA